ncbi:LIC_10190 family membrane protein [Flavobacterium sp. RHBU_3]|uniref:LIC_10190 family membrane protein n=1 Tax=Flavobacterium sp. RHBU_3 TaxID=3391184 RepID=UPI0039853762
MIIILIYWLLLFFLFLPIGCITVKQLKIQTSHISIILLMGMFTSTLFFTLASFFVPLGVVSFVVIALLSATSWLYCKNECLLYLKNFREDFISLPVYLKAGLYILAAGAALKSAGVPFITDNESYYIQNIKWFNEYGTVKGLANLHVFFAQASFWHYLQAGLNFHFITNRINDINGFTFILCIFFYFTEGRKKENASWLLLTAVFSVLLFQFLDTPSPDLPVLVLCPIMVYFYLEQGNDNNRTTALSLFIFLLVIKITVLPLGILFYRELFSKKTLPLFAKAAIPALAIWITKNIIISGYPLYPITAPRLNTSWTAPRKLVDFVVKITSDHGYYKGAAPAGNPALGTKLLSWYHLPGIAGIVNKLALLLFTVTPILAWYKKQKSFFMVYLAFALHFITLLVTSPQFRYFLPGVIFLLPYTLMLVTSQCPAIRKYLLVGCCIAAWVPFINIGLKGFTKNKLNSETGSLTLTQLYLPEINTRFKNMRYPKTRKGNMEYYYPEKDFLLYGTANGPLPCVNKRQVESIEKKLQLYPQLIDSTDIGKGFYSKTEVPQ